ncbi:MAG: hypothetical protein ACLTHH_06075 [Eubacterium sp.]
MTKKMNREMAVVTYLFMILFLIMAGYIVYFVVHDSDKVLNNPQNKRQELLAKRVTKASTIGGRTCLYQPQKMEKRQEFILMGNYLPM